MPWRSIASERSPARIAALSAGALGTLGTLFAFVVDPSAAPFGYLIGFVFWWDIALGTLALLMLQHVMRSHWGRTSRPWLEASSSTFPMLGIAFVPVLVSMPGLYPWTDRAASPSVNHDYLETRFFIVRAAVYFAIWIALASRLRRISGRASVISGAGLVLFFVTATFAAIDWVRSLEPEFRSTTFGLYFVTGQGVSALALAALVMSLAPIVDTACLHDLAKVLLSFVILWAYVAFTQFFIIWNGNLPDESVWYVHRSGGVFSWLVVALIVLHFAVPLLALLPRATNERARWLIPIVLLLLVMRAVDIYWLIAPAHRAVASTAAWSGVASIVGIGGFWMASAMRALDAFHGRKVAS